MHREIERKWLLESAPSWLDRYPHRELVQGYLCTDPVIRVRKEDNEHILSYKGKGGISRTEYNLPISGEEFNKLIRKCDGIIIIKTRYYVPVGDGLKAEVDVFHGVHYGLIYAEVEFGSLEDAYKFEAPDWFGEELTGKPGCSNAELSTIRNA